MEPRAKRPGRGPDQLPPGRHKFSRQYVKANQRERILAAIVDVTSLVGYAAVSVEDIIAAAGVSRRTFYDHFRDKEEAFLAALDGCCERVRSDIRAASADGETFAARVRGSLAAFVQFVIDEPRQADMLIVEVPAAGTAATERRSSLMRVLAQSLTRGAERDLRAHRPPELTAETIVGGIYEVVYSRVLEGRGEELLTLLPDLVHCALLPYLGHERALEESAPLDGPVELAERASA